MSVWHIIDFVSVNVLVLTSLEIADAGDMVELNATVNHEHREVCMLSCLFVCVCVRDVKLRK
jgi:hypothetical protein